MKQNKIIIKVAKNRQTFVVVKGKNNETVATTETYKKMQGAEKAAESLKRIVKNAIIINKTNKS